MVRGVCAVAPTYGVMTYDVTGPPEVGAVQVTFALLMPPSVAATFVTWPGTGTRVQDVDPVVRRVVAVGRERARGRIREHAVVRGRVRKGVQGPVVDAGEQAGRRARVVPVRREVGGDVRRAGGHRDRAREGRRLPAGRALVGEGHLREPRAGRRPQAAGVRAGVGRGLVEADAGDRAVVVGLELHAELDRVGVERIDDAGGGEVEDRDLRHHGRGRGSRPGSCPRRWSPSRGTCSSCR